VSSGERHTAQPALFNGNSAFNAFRLVCLTDNPKEVRSKVECFELPELGYLGQSQALMTRRQLEQCREQGSYVSEPALFTIRLACANDAVPPYNVVSTTFQGHSFYIPAGSEAGNRTLETLSLLSYLVGLQ